MSRFYRETVPHVNALACALLNSREDAEEVVCDVYAYVWRDPTAYDPSRGSVQAWLTIMTRHRAIDRLRRRRNMLSLDDERLREVRDSLRGTEPSPDGKMEQTQTSRIVHRALLSLSPLRRRLVSLSFFQEWSHQEIAAAVELPLGTVKAHLRRTLARLRVALPSLESA